MSANKPGFKSFKFGTIPDPMSGEPPAIKGFRPVKLLVGLGALVVLMTVWRTFVLVGAGERAVVYNRFSGTEHRQLGEGLHPMLPWVQSPTLYDIKSRTYTMSGGGSESDGGGGSNDALTALTADGLPVALDLSVRFHPDPEQVWKLHQEVGEEYLEKVVRPLSRSEVRMVVARYPVIDVYGGRRAAMIDEINARLRDKLAKTYLILDETLLRDVRFSQQFHDAIEQKQVAQQEVQQMRFVLDQADKERRRKIIEAEGEAESIRLKAASLAQNPQLVEYEYVQKLPANVRAIVTDGKTILNVDGAPVAAAAAEGQ